MNIGEARTFVQEALEPLGVNVYTTAPQGGVTPPAIIIKPSNDWITRITLGQFQVNMDLVLTGQPAGTNEAAMERLESLINQIVDIFPVTGSIQAPVGEKIGQADLLTTTLPISVMVTE
jgi:hypothetical protein